MYILAPGRLHAVTPTKAARPLSLALVLPTLYLSLYFPQSQTHTHTMEQEINVAAAGLCRLSYVHMLKETRTTFECKRYNAEALLVLFYSNPPQHHNPGFVATLFEKNKLHTNRRMK